MSSGSVNSIALERWNTQISAFSTSAWRWTWMHNSWTWVHNYKPNQRYQNHFWVPTPSGQSRSHKLYRPRAWRTDKKLNILASPAVCELRSPSLINLSWWQKTSNMFLLRHNVCRSDSLKFDRISPKFYCIGWEWRNFVPQLIFAAVL